MSNVTSSSGISSTSIGCFENIRYTTSTDVEGFLSQKGCSDECGINQGLAVFGLSSELCACLSILPVARLSVDRSNCTAACRDDASSSRCGNSPTVFSLFFSNVTRSQPSTTTSRWLQPVTSIIDTSGSSDDPNFQPSPPPKHGLLPWVPAAIVIPIVSLLMGAFLFWRYHRKKRQRVLTAKMEKPLDDEKTVDGGSDKEKDTPGFYGLLAAYQASKKQNADDRTQLNLDVHSLGGNSGWERQVRRASGSLADPDSITAVESSPEPLTSRPSMASHHRQSSLRSVSDQSHETALSQPMSLDAHLSRRETNHPPRPTRHVRFGSDPIDLTGESSNDQILQRSSTWSPRTQPAYGQRRYVSALPALAPIPSMYAAGSDANGSITSLTLTSDLHVTNPDHEPSPT